MKAIGYSCQALSIGLAAALLSACSDSVPTTDVRNVEGYASSGSKAFSYTGKRQSFIVPAGVTQLTVHAEGAVGGGYRKASPSEEDPGFGGRVYAVIPVTPGEKLYVYVGGQGGAPTGGFNGGGTGGNGNGCCPTGGFGGGGASDVRAGGGTLKDRIIVAAGGGGAGEGDPYSDGYGGDGGGRTGLSGGPGGSTSAGRGGNGGSQDKGGSGGAGGTGSKPSDEGGAGANGTRGRGGDGGAGSVNISSYAGVGGGGGGGGYYGGGGGGGGAAARGSSAFGNGGGGGGGASFIESSAIKAHTAPNRHQKENDGNVVMSWN